MSVHEDGSTYCFACERTTRPDGRATNVEQPNTNWVPGVYHELKSRGLTEETCKKYGYQVGRDKDKWFQIANYRDDRGTVIAQKLRFEDKSFAILGNGKGLPLFGQWLFKSGGKYLTITEGELDAMAFSQAFDNAYPVVSVPNGAPDAKKSIARHLEWINSFDSVVLCFDMDEPGRKAVEECAMLFPPGKVKVMNLPEKDANEVLLTRGVRELVSAFWAAKDWRPDGIIPGTELTRDRLKQAAAKGYMLDLPKFDAETYGLRKGELTVLTAGSGIGKSTWMREIAYRFHQTYGLKIGNVFLEENVNKTGQAYVAIHNNVPLPMLRRDPNVVSDTDWDRALSQVVWPRQWFYDHFGSLDSNNLLSKLRYLATAEGVDFIFLDHISIVHSGVMGDEGERKEIDMLMTKLRSLVEETGVGMVAVVHLKRKQGTSYNDGGKVGLTDLRGAASLEQFSDNVFALERDQQHKDESERHISTIRILKCRETGASGTADELQYSHDTGRLLLACRFETNKETGAVAL